MELIDTNAVLAVEAEHMEAANVAAQSFRLIEICLADAKVNRNLEATYNVGRNLQITYPDILSLEHTCSTDFFSWGVGSDEDEDYLIAVIKGLPEDHPVKKVPHIFGARTFVWSFLCKFRVAAFSDKKPDELVMEIEASFCITFETIPGWKMFDYLGDKAFTINEDLKYLDNFICIPNAWPYWREFVQSMSARVGFPALTVPMLEIVAKKPEEQPKYNAVQEIIGEEIRRVINLPNFN